MSVTFHLPGLAARIGQTLDAAGDEAPREVVRLIGEAFDAGCLLLFFAHHGRDATAVAAWHADDDVTAVAGEFVGAPMRFESDRALPALLRGEPLLLPGPVGRITPWLHPAAHPHVARCDMNSLVISPVTAGGALVGALYLWRRPPAAPFTTDEVEAVATLSRRTAVALDRHRLAAAHDEAERRFRSAFDAAPIGMALFSVDPSDEGRLLETNEALGRILGYSPEQLARMSALELSHPDDVGLGTDDAERLVRGEIAHYGVEKRFVRADGSVVWADLRVSLVRDAEGTPLYGVCQFADLTEHRLLMRETERLASLVEHHADAIIGAALDGTIVSWNRGAEAMFGVPASEAIGKTMSRFAPEHLRGESLELIGRVLAGRPVIDHETRRIAADGRGLDVSITLSLIPGPEGEPTGVAGVVRDISEQRRIRAELERSEQRYRRMVEATSEGVWAIAADGRTTFVNDAFAQMVGRERDDLVGVPFDELLLDDAPGATDGGEPPAGRQRVQARLLGPGGTAVVALLSFAPIRGDDGDVSGIIVLVTDVTERVQAESALRDSVALNRAILEAALDAIVTVDGAGTVMGFNAAAERMFGRPRTEVIGRLAQDVLVAPHDHGKYVDALSELGRGGDSVEPGRRFEITGARAGGETFPAEISASVVRADPAVFTGHVRDLTERKRAERDRERRTTEHARVAHLTRSALEGVPVEALLDEAARMVVDVLDVDAAEIWETPEPGGSAVRAASAGDAAAGTAFARRGGPLAVEDTRGVVERRDVEGGHDLPEAWRAAGFTIAGIVRIGDGAHTLGHLCALSRSYRELAPGDRAFLETTANVLSAAVTRSLDEDERAHRALHDELTGLANRTLFVDRLARALARWEADATPVAVLYLDIDDFKYTNDTLGHEAGDRLLIEFARRLGAAALPADTAARFGGDEFAVLLQGGDPEALGRQVLEAVSGVYVLDEGEVVITASIGIVLAQSAVEHAEGMLRNADIAMYRAKEAGGAAYQFFDETMRSRLLDRLETERDLRVALREQELFLAYQPHVSLTDGRIPGVEALLRWRHPRLGVVEPDAFLPVAEASGLVVPVDRWALRETVMQLARWQADPDLDLGFAAVNVSGATLATPSFAEEVLAVLAQASVAPARLRLELTEAALAQNAAAEAAVVRLREAGVRIVLDRFGTGNSSLGNLRRFAVDSVKIDRAFVRTLAEGDGDRHIVQAIVGMTRGLGVAVSAQGVEQPEQARWLRRLGCGVAQGVALAPPAPPDEVAALVREGLDLAELAPAFGPVEERAPDARPRTSLPATEESVMTLGEAAQALGVSASTARRWANSGRLRAVRTSGGHRRFTRADVTRAAGRAVTEPEVHGVTPPQEAMPAIERVLLEVGARSATLAGRQLYTEGRAGWFGSEGAGLAIERWVLDLSAAVLAGAPDVAADATLRLVDDAREGGAGLVECHGFLGRFAGVLVRALDDRGVAAGEVSGFRILVAYLRQKVLAAAEAW